MAPFSSSIPPGRIWSETSSSNGSTGSEPALRDLCGLLTIQEELPLDAQESAQIEAALRTINSTEIGAELLRAISNFDISAHERPAVIFESDDDSDDSESTYDSSGLSDDDSTNGASSSRKRDGAYVIYFEVMRRGAATASPSSGTQSDTSDSDTAALLRLNQAINLFAELTALYASRTGQSCPEPALGFGKYSTLTFREQAGDTVPRWQRDLEAYIRDAAMPDENRVGVWQNVDRWNQAENPEQPLQLNSLVLSECPPLQNLPGLEWLELVDNRLTAFPPAGRLPPTITAIDLAGNPIRTPANSHGPNLSRVTLDSNVCENVVVRGALPPTVEIIPAGPEYVNVITVRRFTEWFPETTAGLFDIEEIERQGWTNDVTARMYKKDMLEAAVANWLSYPNNAWRNAQRADPNAAFSLSLLIKRLYQAWTKDPNPDFKARFVELLSKMQQPGQERFMHECLNVAREGARSCDDQILLTLNNLHIASLNADAEAGVYDSRIIELMHHGEDMLNLHTLTQFFVTLRPELRRRARDMDLKGFDEVEHFLHLQKLLRDSVHLPAMQFNMQFDRLSVVNDADADAARERIASARNTDYLDFLGSWAPLQSVISRTAPVLLERAGEWRDHIYHDRGGVYGLLDRMLQTDGRLFASTQKHGMDVFNIKPRMFWTRYERLVDRYLANRGLDRDMPDALLQACSAVSNEIDALIQRTTTREFLTLRNLQLQKTIQEAEQPRWFTRLRKNVS
ncbi:MAG TPA: NEL-type E3 ubiquitin ligase domain-containing protein [Bordetella sp.]|nr:NEL-type E3 ubiquitin ligase domain-containing protein [Bordetella sp.]